MNIIKTFIFLFLLVSSSYANKKKIVILNSYHPTFTWTQKQTNSIIDTINKYTKNVDIYIEYLDAKRNKLTKEYEKSILNLLKQKYINENIDIIICTDDHAINFIKKYKTELFSKDINILFSGVNNLNILKDVPKNITGVYERMTPVKNYYLAKKIDPNLDNIYLIGDNSVTFKVLEKIFVKELNNINANYKIISDKNIDKILPILKEAPKNSLAIAVMPASFKDKENRSIPMKEALKQISANFKYPIISPADVINVGYNIIGGHCVDGNKQGKLVANMALNILNGRDINNIKPILTYTNNYIFDHQVLKRFNLNIDKLKLDENIKIINKPQTFYNEYSVEIKIFSIIVIAIILLLITSLYYSIKLKKINKNIQLIIDSILEGVIVSKNCVCINCNNAAVQILGYSSKDEIIGKNLNDFMAEESKNSLQKRLNLDISLPKEETMLTKDNNQIQTLNMAKNIHTEQGLLRVGTFVDLSDSKRKDKLLFEQSRLAAMGEMIGNIAHQWRQPLSVISTTTSSMQIQKEFIQLTDEDFNEGTELILNSVEYLSKTIDDFRDYIKGEHKLEEFYLNDIIENSLKIVGPTLKHNNIKVIKKFNNNAKLNSYPNQLMQILINILNNAKDALEKNNKTDSKFIFIEVYKNSTNIMIKIKDNAGGVPNNIIDKIFDPYFTTKDKDTGTGLGLFMSNKLINDSLNGELSVTNISSEYENKEYTGAQFQIVLPI